MKIVNRITVLLIESLDTTAVYVDGTLEVIPFEGDIGGLQRLVEVLEIEFAENEVSGEIWSQYEDVPVSLPDALRAGNLQAAQPVSDKGEF